MTKQYIILRINTKEMESPNGCHTSTHFHHNFVEVGWGNTFDTLEEAEETLAKIIDKHDNYTIMPFYTHD